MKQEEGWVVCRAFKKPCPSHKQGFEPWNNGYYVRSDSSYYRPPSFPSTMSSTVIHNFDLVNHGTNLDQPPFPSESFKSSNSPFESPMIELPNLDSPSISTSFTTNDNNFEQANEDIIEDEKRNLGNQFSDWKSFDKLLASQFIGPSSYAYTNMPLVPHYDDLDAQNQICHVLECFPDL